MEWGAEGLLRLAPPAEVLVIVDVLSFSTTVEAAVSRGAAVVPCRPDRGQAERLAGEKNAALAVGRRQMDARHPYSLSPLSMERLKNGERLVLPSPNGATLSSLAADLCPQVLSGCLRNARAVAARAQQLGASVLVIAAGELWREAADDSGQASSGVSLRPAYEDLVGAGAILGNFTAAALSPEASAAVAAFRAAESSLESLLMECVSGRELCEAGFADDVRYAARLNCSRTAPELTDGEYRAD
jgi:2-phosphosulfolactate phosphatase